MTLAPAIAPLEKTPLEVYVAPDKPSLVGASRAEIAEMLGGIGVPERERKMRAQQIWHWLYVRGAQDFGPMSSIGKIDARRTRKAFHARPAGGRDRAGLRPTAPANGCSSSPANMKASGRI